MAACPLVSTGVHPELDRSRVILCHPVDGTDHPASADFTAKDSIFLSRRDLGQNLVTMTLAMLCRPHREQRHSMTLGTR